MKRLILTGLLTLFIYNGNAKADCNEIIFMQPELNTYNISISIYSINHYKKISYKQIINIYSDRISETRIITKYYKTSKVKSKKIKGKFVIVECNNYFIFLKNLIDNNIMKLTSPELTVIGSDRITIKIQNDHQSNLIDLQAGDMNNSIMVIYNLIVNFLEQNGIKII